MQYEYKPSGTVLFKIGDVGEHYYIIVSGSAYLLVPKEGIERYFDN